MKHLILAKFSPYILHIVAVFTNTIAASRRQRPRRCRGVVTSLCTTGRFRCAFDSTWTDSFIEALMASKYGEGIARDWAVQGAREKKNLLKSYIVGLLKDAGVLKGSYDAIATKVALTEKPRTFSRSMADGKKRPYAEWVKEYVKG